MRPGARFGPSRHPRREPAAAAVQPGAGHERLRSALSLADLGDLHTTPGNAERTTAADRRSSWSPSSAPAPPQSPSAATTRSCSASCAPTRPSTGRLGVVLLDAHADTWEQYYGERYFHGTPFKRAMEEGLIDPHRSLLAGMRGSLYDAADLDEPRGWGFEIVHVRRTQDVTPAHYAARVANGSAKDPPSSFDIDRSTPRSHPPRARPTLRVLPHEAIAFLRALRGMTLHRVRPRRGRPRLRHQRAAHRAAGGEHRLRVDHPDSTVSWVSASCGRLVPVEFADDEQAQGDARAVVEVGVPGRSYSAERSRSHVGADREARPPGGVEPARRGRSNWGSHACT